MYGHVMFNAHSNIFYTWKREKFGSIKLILFIALDSTTTKKKNYSQHKYPTLNLSHALNLPFQVLAKDSKLYSYEFFYQQSFTKAFCFSDISVGMLTGLDHYNKSSLRSDWLEYSQFLESEFKIATNFPGTAKFRVLIINRYHDRKIINVDELVKLASSSKFNCLVQVVYLETLSFSEQFSLFRRHNIVLGIDGSGLLNIAFAKPCTALIRIYPWGSTVPTLGNLIGKGGNFIVLAKKVGGLALSYEVSNRSHTVPPLIQKTNRNGHFIHHALANHPGASIDELKLLNISLQPYNSRLSYFLYQDSYLDPLAFARLLAKSIKFIEKCSPN